MDTQCSYVCNKVKSIVCSNVRNCKIDLVILMIIVTYVKKSICLRQMSLTQRLETSFVYAGDPFLDIDYCIQCFCTFYGTRAWPTLPLLYYYYTYSFCICSFGLRDLCLCNPEILLLSQPDNDSLHHNNFICVYLNNSRKIFVDIVCRW